MVQTCCVINCHNRSRDRSGDKKDGVTFFPFPTWKQSQGAVICELTKRRRMAWIAAVRRPHITFDAITRHMLVCSRHFHTGRPAYEMDESHPDWAPSLHLGHTEVEAADKRLHITLYEEELSPTREENERLRQQLEAVCKTRVVLHVEDIHQLIGHQKERSPQPQNRSSTLEQAEEPQPIKEEGPQPTHIKEEEVEPQPPYVKEEEEELSITQEGEHLLGPEEADHARLPLTGVSVKTEDPEDKPPESSQLHHSPSEEMREAEPSCSSSLQHMTTEADGDHCGGSQADNLLAPLSDSDDTTSHSPEGEDSDFNQESLSSDTDCEGDMMTHTGDKHSESSKKKTGKRFNCSVCDKRFSRSGNLSRHMRTHTGEKPFSCSHCGKSFTLKTHMQSHMRTHTGEKPFSCSDCGKRFTQKSDMQSHMRAHTGEKPFSCPDCGKRFTSKTNIQSHMRTHTGEKPFICSDCGQCFTQKTHMQLHMRTHTGEKPFSCSDCGKRFSRKTNMQRHMRTHIGEKPFTCSDCGTSFTVKTNMQLHMRTHTGEKPFSCSDCGKPFTQKSDMQSHMRTHTGEKPFSCSDCGKRFSRKTRMISHMRTHTGEKPYSCSYCGKRFNQKTNMQRHMRIHTGEKPFSCSNCGDTFSWKYSLIRHMQNH
ncbi:zinc finger protein ZFP2-like isoform X1 [Dunckerocampus dactyliophorus]|uniref:zinc finger protein ZFP2-like isoform X1 n=1 Tax=Dunckerocampus dactyliophorus TaxID=161453 RepID=UPI002404FFCF|nr:zinc finger protein ZFP2-like isoform X1 [Dunckerocampus dactyliophorus]